ncbi:UNC-like C-terminal-domain-containing protein [Colletotrichum phormii]|uniref:UNC-like C-terminal-domain-containing protein n=1 Tax=Colletotrichum phormii TaxID=359342 RepID=A0AAJ0EHC0_9PEZI|nr:UNC-like C-terminal-domain-containing protein [Colletotrichum phormii]KAK1640282.1 UNC-like C-terminal-domain-containing protein [Colletotrichum phormii]
MASHVSDELDTTPTNTQIAFCQFKTINYITHTLPQQCLTTSWPGSKAISDGSTPINDSTRPPPDNSLKTTPSAGDTVVAVTDVPTSDRTGNDNPNPSLTETATDDEVTPRPFMSFEEWKEMMLRKAGQDPSELKARKTVERATEHDRAARSSGLDSLGIDDGEIDLNFDVVSEKISNIASAPQAIPTDVATSDQQQEPVLYDDGRTQYYRSKDAGKTCKERFSYSSFDAGATVLKTNKGAKNAKAILVENKDSYMLLECSAGNKFVIVELSDDILVDTVVLANFEFFSSMVRHFRISVSDRYPVKVDKWKDLGTFEAKNSRDIQPFLVQNPLIWAKYVRIEFLTHYGNEFYCPVSLLRVHGTRMLESWKDQETPIEEEEVVEEPVGQLPSSATNAETGDNTTFAPPRGGSSDLASDTTPNLLMPRHIFSPLDWENPTCPPLMPLPHSETRPLDPELQASDRAKSGYQPSTYDRIRGGDPAKRTSEDRSAFAPANQTDQIDEPYTSSSAKSVSAGAHQSSIYTDPRPGGGDTAMSGTSSTKTAQATVQSRNKNNSTAAPASPTVQESFFKAVSKRLQYLESNVSLSLRYIEDQSRYLQEIQKLAERKQLSRIDIFLDSLNKTVLSELRTVRQQYDQIWQSTVIALESQREQSQRETVALSSRLNILADEVVFQKRMAIVQAILLLSCLILVIFSRAMTQPILAGSFDLGRTSNLNHPEPGISPEPVAQNTYTSAYDNFGRPCDQEGHGGRGSLKGDSGALQNLPGTPARLLTPASEDGYNYGPPESNQCGPTRIMMPQTHLVDTIPEDDSADNYRGSSLDFGEHCIAEETTLTSNNVMQHGRGFSPQNPLHSAGVLLDSPLEREAEARLPNQPLGIVSSAVRKPLPALPE